MPQNNKYDLDSIIRILGIAALSVIIFALIYNLSVGGGRGFGFSMHYSWNLGLGGNPLMLSLVAIFVKILWVVFWISLIGGIYLLVKKLIDERKTNLCSNCCLEINSHWKFCPGCGNDI